jgi:hypothetical protein
MERALVVSIRILAVLLGAIWIGAGLMDALGLLPHSEATPPLAQRLAHKIPLAAAGVLLVAPYRFVRSGRVRFGVAFALCLCLAWLVYLSAGGILGYLTGQKSWHVVPAAFLLSALAAANLWAFTRITRKTEDRT